MPAVHRDEYERISAYAKPTIIISINSFSFCSTSRVYIIHIYVYVRVGCIIFLISFSGQLHHMYKHHIILPQSRVYSRALPHQKPPATTTRWTRNFVKHYRYLDEPVRELINSFENLLVIFLTLFAFLCTNAGRVHRPTHRISWLCGGRGSGSDTTSAIPFFFFFFSMFGRWNYEWKLHTTVPYIYVVAWYQTIICNDICLNITEKNFCFAAQIIHVRL